MQKTPDEIKKGLECCITDNCKGCPYYPLYEVFGCKLARAKDALALIQQLQAENAEKDARIQQLEAERDAAMGELKRIGDCMYCKHDELCTTVFPNCAKCEKSDCPCHTCSGWNNWEWRGVQKEE